MTRLDKRLYYWHRESPMASALLLGLASLAILTLLSLQLQTAPALRALFILPIWIGTRLGGRFAGLILVVFATLANTWLDLSAGSDATSSFIWLGVFCLFMLLVAQVEDALGRSEHLALRDPLTGLLNRRGLEAEGPRLIERAIRGGQGVSVVMVDCDRFKGINDGFGHRAGDETLKFLAETLQANTRSSDVISRLGGDEFVLVLSSVDHAEAEMAVSRIERAFAEGMAERGFDASLSAGCAQSSAEVHDLRSLLAIADEAMYLRKEIKRSSSLAS
jgi:diguanylate cyclase (GGDEF)-like protein